MSSLGAGVDSLPVAGAATPRPPHPGDYLRQMAALGVFFGLAALVSPVAWLVGKATGGRFPSAWGQRILGGLFRFFVGWMRVTGTLAWDTDALLPLRNVRGTIVAANHPGLLDAVLLLSTGLQAACVMRAGLLRNPFFRGGALAAGYVTNDSGPAMVRQSNERIRAGGNLLIFPEGTRTREQAVNSFRQGFALVAVQTGAPVQTVLIEREGNYLAKGVPLFAPAVMPLRYRARLGPCFTPHAGEPAREFAARLETWFRGQLENRGGDIRIKDL